MQPFRFGHNTALEMDIYEHFTQCKDTFIPHLDQTIDLRHYAKKIRKFGQTFEVWDDQILVALVAVYLNNVESKQGFITNVSTLNPYRGHRLAVNLLEMCKKYARSIGFLSLRLDVHEHNEVAIQLYKKLAFEFCSKQKQQITMVLDLQNIEQ